MLDHPRRATPVRGLFASLLLLPVLGACAGAPLGTAAAPVPAAYIVRLGSDTIAAERFTRTPSAIEGDLLLRAQTPPQQTVIQHYVISLGSDGRPTRIEIRTRRPDGTMVPNGARSVTLTFSGDSVTREIMRDTLVRQRIAAANAMPTFGNPISVAVAELALAAVRASGRDSADVNLLGAGAPRSTAWPVKIVGPDAARIWYFGDPQHVRVNAQGHIFSVDATQTTNKVTITPVPSVDLVALGTEFAAREQRGVWIGTTRDTVRAQLAGASLWVDYGRPMARGRTLFTNEGVLGDTIWRTGANAATQFRTDRELVIGGQTVPAGTYTLFTHARNGRYELIINKQTGQWGTEYHPEQDLVRVPLAVATLGAPSDRFTIAVEPGTGSEGTLALHWGTMRLTTPIVVR